jgi:hypothetical protein
VLSRLEPREVGEDRRLHRLEELQGRPHDQHHVEHEAGDSAGQAAGPGVGGHDQHAGVHQRLLGEHDPDHRDGKARPVTQREMVGDLLLETGVGRALTGRVGNGDPGPAADPHPRQRERHHGQGRERRDRHAQPDDALARADPDDDRQREQETRGRLQEDEPTVEGEALVAGQPAAGEVARPVGDHSDDEDPVQGARAIEHAVLDLTAQGDRDDQEHAGEADLDRRGHPQRLSGQAAGATVGDRAREQLLDRAVDHRQDHEHDRPAQRDAAVGRLVEGVAGRGQVGEGEDARRGDPDRQDPRPGGIGRPALGAAGGRVVLGCGRGRLAPGRRRHQAIRTSNIVHGNGERISVTVP